jgi:hypothetical protein
MNKLILLGGGTVVAVGAIMATSGLALASNGNGLGMGGSNGSGYTQQLEVKASALKLTTAQLQDELKTKTLIQLAAEKNVSMDAIHEATAAQARTRWQANGLSAEQIKTREAAMAERQADCDGTGMGGGQHRGQTNN